jgi:hypothetical protein
MTLLPRILAALASGLVAKLALWLDGSLGLTMTKDERDWLIGALVTVLLTAYGVLHRKVSARVNPDDKAAR